MIECMSDESEMKDEGETWCQHNAYSYEKAPTCTHVITQTKFKHRNTLFNFVEKREKCKNN